MQILPEIQNEYGRLDTVVVGLASKMGGVPKLEECYDARSYESVKLGMFPKEESCSSQLKSLVTILEKNGVKVIYPALIDSLNQVFSRDIAFVIEDQYIIPNVIADRTKERDAMAEIEENIPSWNIIMMPSGCFAEGGDVIVDNDHVFVGVSNDETFDRFKTARTNFRGMDYLADEFPAKEFKGFELHKDDRDPLKGSLHLDCAFQPISGGALIAPHLFKNEADVKWLIERYGETNVYSCSPEEAYSLATNVFSFSPKDITVSEKCEAMQYWLRERGLNVHSIVYDEIVKMGGLLRCTTMPLKRV
jgi:N-dimethylarginine dimethylaminohydrolase